MGCFAPTWANFRRRDRALDPVVQLRVIDWGNRQWAVGSRGYNEQGISYCPIAYCPPAGIASTGQGACLNTRSVVLPRSASR